MSPGAVDDVNAPKSIKNIVVEVMEYVERHNFKDGIPIKNQPIDFDTYDAALHAVWPELFKTSPEAALLVSISIYMDIAERWGFEANVPDEIKPLRL